MSQLAYLVTRRGRGYSSLPRYIYTRGGGAGAPYRRWFWTWKTRAATPRGCTPDTHGNKLPRELHICSTLVVLFKSGCKWGLKGCFWGVFFALFWGFSKKTLGNIFLYGLFHMCVVYMMVYVIVEWKSVIVIGVDNYDRQCLNCDWVDVIVGLLFV